MHHFVFPDFNSNQFDNEQSLRALAGLLKLESKGRSVDFMTVDLKSLEFLLLLLKERSELPVICQVNVGLDFEDWENVDQILDSLLREGHFIALNVDAQKENTRRLFLFNVGDQECITKFLC